MSGFRLQRVLRLREEDERLAKVAWAEAVRASRDAAARVEEAREAHRAGVRAQEELQAGLANGGPRSGALMVQLERGADAVDALAVRIQELETARLEAANHAALARAEFDAARSRAQALARLEEKWVKEQRLLARRRGERQLDDVLAARRIAEQNAANGANAS